MVFLDLKFLQDHIFDADPWPDCKHVAKQVHDARNGDRHGYRDFNGLRRIELAENCLILVDANRCGCVVLTRFMTSGGPWWPVGVAHLQ